MQYLGHVRRPSGRACRHRLGFWGCVRFYADRRARPGDLARRRGDRWVALRAPGVARCVFIVLRAMFCAKRGNHGESARRARGAGVRGFSVARRPVFEKRIPARLLSIRFSDNLRSEEQAFAIGGFLSLGIVLASQTMLSAMNKKPLPTMSGAVPSPEILSVPLIVGFFLTLGLSSAYAIPAPLRANWVFRFHINSRSRECVPLARKMVSHSVVPAGLAICLPVYSHFWGWRVGMTHTALVAVWSVLLMEGLLARFRKIPFTCSLPKFKSHGVSAMLLILGYFAFTSVTATVESWALVDPLWFIVFVSVVLGVSVALCRRRKTMVESDRRIIFEERSMTVVEVLNLNS